MASDTAKQEARDKTANPWTTRIAAGVGAVAMTVAQIIASISPETAQSNVSAWARASGVDAIGPWMASTNADRWIFMLGGLGIGFWLFRSQDARRLTQFVSAKVQALLRKANGIEQSTEPGRHIYPPTVKTSLPERLSAEEAERRIRALDEMFEILNTRAEVICSAGNKLADPGLNLLYNEGAQTTAAALRAWRAEVDNLTETIRGLLHKHALHQAIFPPVLTTFGFQERLSDALDKFAGGLGLMEEVRITRKTCLLLAHHVPPLQKAVNVMRQWVADSKAGLRARRTQLLGSQVAA